MGNFLRESHQVFDACYSGVRIRFEVFLDRVDHLYLFTAQVVLSDACIAVLWA